MVSISEIEEEVQDLKPVDAVEPRDGRTVPRSRAMRSRMLTLPLFGAHRRIPGKLKIRFCPDSRMIQPELNQGLIQTHAQLENAVQKPFATNCQIRNR